MDNIISYIFLTVILAFAYQFYYTYFKKGAKISDEQLMKNYVSWKMKKSHTRYFPKMKIGENYE